MMPDVKKKDLEKQGYRLVGNHSAIKVCLWTKKSLRDEDVCYKNTFYGIQTHRCVQMTPTLPFCNQRCVWCWRDTDFTQPKWTGPIDSPKEIVDGCIREHVKYLEGFKGNPKCNLDKLKQAPLHFAISLSGEPTFYPKLPELIKEIHNRKMTTFLVTNGTNPDVLEQLLKKNIQPTQLYITLPAPDEETYIKSCSPLIKDGWEKINASLELLHKFKRNVIRLTLVKDFNMIKPEKYAALFKKYNHLFIELKAYVWVGFSRERLSIENMPRHDDIVNFAKEIIKHYPELKIIDEKPESRVVLLMKQDKKDRIMEF